MKHPPPCLHLSAVKVGELTPLEVTREKCARGIPGVSLAEFFVWAWPILNPSDPLQWNWHIQALCDHVQAQLEDGEFGKPWTQNLLIDVPPGSTKSTVLSVCAPAWKWTWRPSWRVSCFSSNPDVGIRDSLACRRLIQSQQYQEAFLPSWQLSPVQNEKDYYQNTATGFRMAKGSTADVTGDRPSAIIIDDPLDAKDAASEVKRVKVNADYDQALGGRIADPTKGTRTIIMQRLHEEDLAGHVLESGDWSHLKIEQERELSNECECRDCTRGSSFIGWRDPREEEGQLLDPERFTEAVLAGEKRRLGPAGYAGQHQQRPAPAGGVMFDPLKWQMLEVRPAAGRIIRRLRSYDLAATKKKTSAWTVAVEIGELDDGSFVILDVIRERLGPAEVEDLMLNTATTDGYDCGIRWPLDPGQAGLGQENTLTKLLVGYDVEAIPTSGDKVVKATPYSAQQLGGNFFLVVGPWVREFKEEHRTFPFGRFKDQVDAAAQGFNCLRGVNAPSLPTGRVVHVRRSIRGRSGGGRGG